VSTLAPLLAVLIAGVWISRRVQAAQRSVALDCTGADEQTSLGVLRLLLIGGLLGLGLVFVVPWIAATAAPTCTILRPGEACIDGAPQSSAPWIVVGIAAIPLVLLMSGDLGRLRDQG